jgi:hypothetical protein
MMFLLIKIILFLLEMKFDIHLLHLPQLKIFPLLHHLLLLNNLLTLVPIPTFQLSCNYMRH